MYGCSCGYDGNCLSTECGLLRRTPIDPRATWSNLITWHNEQRRYECLEKNPPLWLRSALTEMYDGCQTPEDFLTAYSMMELAGMIYHQVGLGTDSSEWRNRNGLDVQMVS
jgi:hypothetical protein